MAVARVGVYTVQEQDGEQEENRASRDTPCPLHPSHIQSAARKQPLGFCLWH
jgi:hypothetical protein